MWAARVSKCSAEMTARLYESQEMTSGLAPEWVLNALCKFLQTGLKEVALSHEAATAIAQRASERGAVAESSTEK